MSLGGGSGWLVGFVEMSTRRLILTALVCGIAILLAGGIFLFRLSSQKDELAVATLRRIGEPVTVGGAGVTLVEVRRPAGSGQVQGVVQVSASTGSIPDVGQAFTMLQRTVRVAVTPGGLAAGEEACAGRTLPSGGSITCVVAFAAGEGSAYLAFSLPGAAQVQWQL